MAVPKSSESETERAIKITQPSEEASSSCQAVSNSSEAEKKIRSNYHIKNCLRDMRTVRHVELSTGTWNFLMWTGTIVILPTPI